MDFEYYKMPPQTFFILSENNYGKVYLSRGEVSEYNVLTLRGKIEISFPFCIDELIETLNVAMRKGDPIFIDPSEKAVDVVLSDYGIDVQLLPKPLSLITSMNFIAKYMRDRYDKILCK